MNYVAKPKKQIKWKHSWEYFLKTYMPNQERQILKGLGRMQAITKADQMSGPKYGYHNSKIFYFRNLEIDWLVFLKFSLKIYETLPPWLDTEENFRTSKFNGEISQDASTPEIKPWHSEEQPNQASFLCMCNPITIFYYVEVFSFVNLNLFLHKCPEWIRWNLENITIGQNQQVFMF